MQYEKGAWTPSPQLEANSLLQGFVCCLQCINCWWYTTGTKFSAGSAAQQHIVLVLQRPTHVLQFTFMNSAFETVGFLLYV